MREKEYEQDRTACAYWSIKQALNDSKFKTNVDTLEDLYLFSQTPAEQDLRINYPSDAGSAEHGALSPVFTACSRNAKIQLPAKGVLDGWLKLGGPRGVSAPFVTSYRSF